MDKEDREFVVKLGNHMLKIGGEDLAKRKELEDMLEKIRAGISLEDLSVKELLMVRTLLDISDLLELSILFDEVRG